MSFQASETGVFYNLSIWLRSVLRMFADCSLSNGGIRLYSPTGMPATNAYIMMKWQIASAHHEQMENLMGAEVLMLWR